MESVPKVALKVVDFSRPIRHYGIREILDSEDAMRQLNEADDVEIFNPIVLTDGRLTYRYALEDEIVVYRADESLNYYCCAREVDGLNTFIKEIAVSNFFFGKYHGFGYYIRTESDLMSNSYKNPDTFAYYEDNLGNKNVIPQVDISNFLKRLPDLCVTSDGLLVFYLGDEILVTSDCNHYIWLHNFEGYVKEVIPYDGYILIKTQEAISSENHTYKVNFSFNLLSRSMIKYEIQEEK